MDARRACFSWRALHRQDRCENVAFRCASNAPDGKLIRDLVLMSGGRGGCAARTASARGSPAAGAPRGARARGGLDRAGAHDEPVAGLTDALAVIGRAAASERRARSTSIGSNKSLRRCRSRLMYVVSEGHPARDAAQVRAHRPFVRQFVHGESRPVPSPIRRGHSVDVG